VNEIVDGTESSRNLGLNGELIFRSKKKYTEMALEHAKNPFNDISGLCMLQVKNFLGVAWPICICNQHSIVSNNKNYITAHWPFPILVNDIGHYGKEPTVPYGGEILHQQADTTHQVSSNLIEWHLHRLLHQQLIPPIQ